MKKVLIAYLSVANHTETLAQYMAEGIRIAGCEPVLKKISELKAPKDLSGYDAYLFGCPTYHKDMPQPMKTFLFLANAAGLAGKAAGAFGSHTHSGEAPFFIFDTLQHVLKMKVVNLGALKVEEALIDTPEYIKACHDYARALCESA